ncbi:MAG: ABC transporter permease [Spirochaetales bacterium]|nr:ABC transporter permease [Leptospiraceae bacterium]MCP5480491.1 ABC transporter permease [Spirochaetales bacterium]
MVLLELAIKSLRNRLLTTVLTLLSIALSVCLLIGVEMVRQSARESFQGTISQTDLIVGARSGPVQLLLYTVFHIGSPTANVSYASFQRYSEDPSVEWTIPISLGDSHRGYRVVATNENFYRHFRFRRDREIRFADGEAGGGVFDVVLGSEVAESLGYSLGDAVVIAHGITDTDFLRHDDKPFRVSGILERTSTPVDRSLFISLAGMEAVHLGWESGGPPLPGQAVPVDRIRPEDLHISQISAFLVGMKSRGLTLRLQRQINTDSNEALLAIIPGVALSEMWRGIGYAEGALLIVSAMVVLVGFVGMLMSIYSSLNERRREMAILRAVGASPSQIVVLFVLESVLLAFLGALLGLILLYGLLVLLQPIIETFSGIYLPIRAPGTGELLYLGAVLVAGFLLGLGPALRAYRSTLADGLTVRL